MPKFRAKFRAKFSIKCPPTLHTLGYTIIEKAIKVSPQLAKSCKARRFATIFNHAGRNDHKRSQASVGHTKIVQRLCADVTRTISTQIGEYTTNDWVVIRSQPGCKEQMAHCDYIPTGDLATAPDQDFPLAVLVAIMPYF